MPIDDSIIREFESCRLSAYICPKGKPTIGWGSTRHPNGDPVKLGQKITQEQAEQYLETEIKRRITAMALPDKLTDNQKSALVSFQYNVGMGNWSKSTLKKKVFINPNDPSIKDEFGKWINKGSKFEEGLRRRRAAEADLYFKIS